MRLFFTPTAAFLLWLPMLLGQRRSSSFGYAQLAYALKINDAANAFGWLFSTNGIPISEFSRYVPFKRPQGVEMLRSLLSSCIVGNIFFPGSLSAAETWITTENKLWVEGGYPPTFSDVFQKLMKKLQKCFNKLRAVIIPGSFKIASPGSDIHYTGTLPMRESPVLCETDRKGAVYGLKGIHVVDGACLPSLSEKSHTLTIMANADRIGREIALLGKQS